MSTQETTPDFWTDAMCGTCDGLTPAQLRHVALGALGARRALDAALPAELIPDPVLDILLALFTLVAPGKRVDHARLGTATTVAPSVVHRYLQALAQYGFVTYDAERDESALTPFGIRRVGSALEAIVRSQVAINAALAAEKNAA